MKCSCDHCKRFADDEDLLLYLDADKFKEKMFALHNFPRHLRDEVDRSDLTYAHIRLGIVPERNESRNVSQNNRDRGAQV